MLCFGVFSPPGRLGQLGLKEGFPSAVKNISAVIGMFIQHAQDEGKGGAGRVAAGSLARRAGLGLSEPQETLFSGGALGPHACPSGLGWPCPTAPSRGPQNRLPGGGSSGGDPWAGAALMVLYTGNQLRSGALYTVPRALPTTLTLESLRPFC